MTPPTAATATVLKEALQLAHDTLHECTNVLSADDCRKVAAVMAQCREALETAPGSEAIDDLWLEICEMDDRTSPEEYPEMCMITQDEFAEFVARAKPERATYLTPDHVADAGDMVGIPADIAEHVLAIGRAEWGRTPAHDAEGHGKHVADSVRLTAANFDQEGDQHMHGLWLVGTETVLCHTGTSPNAPNTTQALMGAWNWLVGQCALAAPETPPTEGDGK